MYMFLMLHSVFMCLMLDSICMCLMLDSVCMCLMLDSMHMILMLDSLYRFLMVTSMLHSSRLMQTLCRLIPFLQSAWHVERAVELTCTLLSFCIGKMSPACYTPEQEVCMQAQVTNPKL